MQLQRSVCFAALEACKSGMPCGQPLGESSGLRSFRCREKVEGRPRALGLPRSWPEHLYPDSPTSLRHVGVLGKRPRHSPGYVMTQGTAIVSGHKHVLKMCRDRIECRSGSLAHKLAHECSLLCYLLLVHGAVSCSISVGKSSHTDEACKGST